MTIGLVATLFAPEPPSDVQPHEPHAGFVEIIWAPIRDLLARLGPMAVAILLLVAGFRMPGYIASAMAVPLFKHQGFTNTEIATVTKVFGFWIALGGTFMAGWLISRIGMMSSLLIGTIAGSASHLALLASHGGDEGRAFWTFALAVADIARLADGGMATGGVGLSGHHGKLTRGKCQSMTLDVIESARGHRRSCNRRRSAIDRSISDQENTVIQPSPFLRRALQADAVFSGASAVLLTLGSAALASILNLPSGLLFQSGLFLIAYAAFVGWLSSRTAVPLILI